MDSVKQKTAYLFRWLDGDFSLPIHLKRRVLRHILDIDPLCARARQLLDALEGNEDRSEPWTEAFEEVEFLALHGAHDVAKEGIECIRDEWGDVPIAQAWLSSVDVLWDFSSARA